MNRLICACLLSTALLSCSRKNFNHTHEYRFTSETLIPDYGDLNVWAAHPWKKDLSDSVPKPLQAAYQQDSLADVFFIHPTTLTDLKDERWNAPVDDALINAKTDYSTILYQASVFNEKCRVFAPRYRQAHIKAFYKNTDDSEKAFEIAYADVKSAFVFYMNNYNKNRPIIIASHSQGTKHAGRLLKEFFENKPFQNQLVCAYIIGLPVPSIYFNELKSCADSLSTGCFVSWRTFKKNSPEPAHIQAEKFIAVVTNPLTWTSSAEIAPSSLNRGAVLTNFNKIVPRAASARVHHNILWSSKPNVPGKILYTKKNYHIGDINLFYINIRENVASRINSFLSKQQN